MIDEDSSCEICFDIATALARAAPDPSVPLERAIEDEYAAIHAHAHSE
ncbi:hypothetical protein ACWIGI_37480 [Nocardia sp. NPDC055321]